MNPTGIGLTPMLDTSTVHSSQEHQPQFNFDSKGAVRVQHEAQFSDKFAEIYKIRHSSIHSCAKDRSSVFVRELPIQANGIPDLVVMTFTPNNVNDASPEIGIPLLRAFEAKLHNWRQGLMQAHRYKYFSDASILVIPTKRIASPCKHIELFKKLNVGLWGFDTDSNVITRIFTPRPATNRPGKYKSIAIEKIRKITRLMPPK